MKIVKKDNCDGANDQIKCIDFDNSHYELDLTTAVAAVGKLLEQDFLNASTGSANSVASTVSGNPGASTGTASTGTESNEIGNSGKNIESEQNASSIVSGNTGKNIEGDKKASSTGTEITGTEITGTEITGNDGSKLPGGSRKNRGQQSKKTKRKYYVYRK